MSRYSDDDVFFCGHCRRQQQVGQGVRCLHCGRETILWNTAKEAAAVIQARWERLRGKK